MFDIYSVVPNAVGTLNHTLIAGNYKKWGDVIFAIYSLNGIVIAKSLPTMPIFVVQNCTHRKSSNQYKTTTTHTAPLTIEELENLL